MKLSEKIKLLRTQEQLTQPELASKAGIEQSYLSKLENDKGTPSFDVINKIAQAFDLSGMELINSLSQSYIEQHLSHIPEVAAEYASIKHRQLRRLKWRFIWSSAVVVLGVGLFFIGSQGVLFPAVEYIYESPGVIKPGETVYQYQSHEIEAINETREQAQLRTQNNRDRLDLHFLTVADYAGNTFIAEVPGGRRVYEYREEKRLNTANSDLVSSLGMMCMVAGMFMFAYAFRFKQ
ncbi:helix-turn-helix domain-containing protein [Marinicella meishanensis]|uniref:helix-turn-helix domain-containing protein n=1 Tax=Marinicella meishanensis TaxID=2873263 RepID=UPI001CBF0EC0|nr:helix-turn-helix transcriptional regulator [Marinicella sp. NBU2979]